MGYRGRRCPSPGRRFVLEPSSIFQKNGRVRDGSGSGRVDCLGRKTPLGRLGLPNATTCASVRAMSNIPAGVGYLSDPRNSRCWTVFGVFDGRDPILRFSVEGSSGIGVFPVVPGQGSVCRPLIRVCAVTTCSTLLGVSASILTHIRQRVSFFL